MFEKIFAKRQSLKNELPSDEDGMGQSGSSNSSSSRVARPQNVSMGACPLEDPASGFQDPQLTLSQSLQKARLEQQKRENQARLKQQNRENQRKMELDRRNTEIITKFIVEHIEPLLRAQALSGLSKTEYIFIPFGTEQAKVKKVMPADKNIVEGFGGSEKSCHYIRGFRIKEYVKVIRLIKPEYSLEFCQQPEIVKELKQALRKRLQANGEKLAETTPNSAGLSWSHRNLVYEKPIPPGHTAVELAFLPTHLSTDPSYAKALFLDVEIA